MASMPWDAVKLLRYRYAGYLGVRPSVPSHHVWHVPRARTESRVAEPRLFHPDSSLRGARGMLTLGCQPLMTWSVF